MKIQVRQGVFETNSSSMHSITVKSLDNYEQLIKDNGGTIYLKGANYFGKPYQELDTPYKKMNYIFTYIVDGLEIRKYKEDKKYLLFEEVIKDYTDCKIELDRDYFYEKYNIENIDELDTFTDLKVYLEYENKNTLDILFYENREKKVFLSKKQIKENLKELIFNNKYKIVIERT